MVLGVILPTHPDHSVLVAPSTCRSLNVCIQAVKRLYVLTRQNLLHFPLSVVLYSLSSLCVYLQWYTVKYDCLNTAGNNTGKWHFVVVETVKNVYGKIFKYSCAPHLIIDT